MTFHSFFQSDLKQAVMLTFAATAAMEGLVAIWVASGRTHWFFRALALWSGVMLLVPIRVYEPAAVFAVSSSLVACVVVVLRLAARLRAGRDGSTCNPARELLPTRRIHVLYGLGVAAALAAIALEPIYQRQWWFDPAAVVAWLALIGTAAAVAYDCVWWRGRGTWPRMIASVRLLTTPLGDCGNPRESSVGAANRGKFRFDIRDLLLLMLLVGMAIIGIQAIDQDYTWQEWYGFVAVGALVATIVVLAYGSVVSRWRLILGPLLLYTMRVAASITPELCDPFLWEKAWPTILEGAGYSWTRAEKLFALEMVYGEMALLIALVTLLSYLARAGAVALSLRVLARRVLAGIAVIGGIPLAWLYSQMFWLTPIPPEFAGGATNFDAIVAVISHVDRNWWSTLPNWVPPVDGDKQELIAELSRLSREPSYVPFKVTERNWRFAEIEVARRMHDQFRSFAKVIDAEAAAAAAQGDCDRAVDLSLLNIRIGTILQRGGVHDENGRFCQGVAYQRLSQIRDRLSPEPMRLILAAFQRAAADIENPSTVHARDTAYEERAEGWTARLRNVFDRLEGPGYWMHADAEIATQQNLLEADLAIRLYQNDRGRLPESLADLVPAYLKAVPLDPLAACPIRDSYAGTVQPLRYRVGNGKYLLYSTGHFGTDNGGVFGNAEQGVHTSTYDVDLDTWTRK